MRFTWIFKMSHIFWGAFYVSRISSPMALERGKEEKKKERRKEGKIQKSCWTCKYK